MARAIPTYQRQFVPQGVQGSATGGTAGTDGSSPIGQAMQNIGQAGMNAARTLQQRENELAQNRSAVDVANVLSEADVKWNQRYTELATAWKVNDPDIRDGLGKEFDTWRDQTAEKFQTIESKTYFLKQTAANKARLMENAFSYQQKATTDKLNVDSVIGQQADETTIYNDPARLNDVKRRRIETVLARTDLPEAEKLKMAQTINNSYNLAAERGELEKDPYGFYAKRFGEFKRSQGGQSLTGTNAATNKLWAAQINQESGGNQNAVSPKGAIGVAQIMPGTGPEAAKLAGLPWDPERLKTDAAYNEKLGRAYMDKQLETFGGDAAKALAAYNMGPGSAEKGNGVAGLVAKYGDDWLSHAPQETQDYVKNIMAKAGGEGPTTTGPRTASKDGGESVTMTMNDTPAQPLSYSSLPYETQINLKHQAETDIKQQDAQLTAGVTAKLRDAQAMHADGKMDPFNFTDEELDAAFQENARSVKFQLEASRAMARDIAQFSTQSEKEIAASLQETAPTEGGGYAADDARHRQYIQSAQKVVQERNADPAAAVLKGSEAVTTAAGAAVQGGPEATQRYATASLGEQLRLGVSNPRLLTNSQAAQIAGAFQDQSKGSANAADLMTGLQQQWGSYFPMVYQQLQATNKLPAEALVIPNMSDDIAKSNMAAVAKLKDDELRDMLPAGSPKEVSDKTLEVMQELQSTMVGVQGGGARTFGIVQKATEKLAMYYVASGKNVGDAVNQAYEETVGHAYQFESTYRIPKTEAPDDIVSGVNIIKQTIGDLPYQMPPAPTGMRPEDAQQQFQSTLQNNAVFVTNNDESGLWLYLQTPTGLVPVRNQAGDQFSFSWQDLRDKALARALEIKNRAPEIAPYLSGDPTDIIGSGSIYYQGQ